MLTPLERVTLTLQHKEADRVPIYPLLNGVARKLVNKDYPTWSTDMSVCKESYLAVTERFELDLICTLIDLSVEAGDFGQKLIFPQTEACYPDPNCPFIEKETDYNKVEPLNPLKTTRMKGHISLCKELVKEKGKTTPIVAFVFGPLGILSMLRGQTALFMDLYDHPEKVKQALLAITETLILYCKELVSTGVTAIMLDTLFASESIMQESMWREFEGEYVGLLAKKIRKEGASVMIHNCGNGPYFEAQVETMNPVAISFLHPAAGLKTYEETQKHWGDKLTLIGYVPPTALPFMTHEALTETCKEMLLLNKKGGGFVLATGCEYPANLGFEQADVMIKAGKAFGRY